MYCIHACTVFIWRCELTEFFWCEFCASYIKHFHSLIHVSYMQKDFALEFEFSRSVSPLCVSVRLCLTSFLLCLLSSVRVCLCLSVNFSLTLTHCLSVRLLSSVCQHLSLSVSRALLSTLPPGLSSVCLSLDLSSPLSLSVCPSVSCPSLSTSVSVSAFLSIPPPPTLPVCVSHVLLFLSASVSVCPVSRSLPQLSLLSVGPSRVLLHVSRSLTPQLCVSVCLSVCLPICLPLVLSPGPA